MADTVLFTGAGASRAIGYPLTNEFLPRILAEIDNGALFSNHNGRVIDKANRDELGRMVSKVWPGLERLRKRAPTQLPLITELLSLVDHALVADEALPIGGETKLRRLKHLLKYAIADILVGDFLSTWDLSIEADRREKATLKAFAGWVEAQGRKLSLVTTNYDSGLEYSLYERIGYEATYRLIDLGFDWRHTRTGQIHKRPSKPGLRVYKLHGSLDLLRCPLCGYLYFITWGALALQPFRSETDDQNTCHCSEESRLDLHIVSPSMVREMREPNLMSVWRAAIETLRTSSHWIIVGYSLPPEDLAVRSLLIRAYHTASKRPRVSIVQRGEEARGRFEALFPKCSYESGGLERFLGRDPAI